MEGASSSSQKLDFLCVSPNCWPAVGGASFCLACIDLISGGLCGMSADCMCRQKIQSYTIGVSVGIATFQLACSNGRDHGQAGKELPGLDPAILPQLS